MLLVVQSEAVRESTSAKVCIQKGKSIKPTASALILICHVIAGQKKQQRKKNYSNYDTTVFTNLLKGWIWPPQKTPIQNTIHMREKNATDSYFSGLKLYELHLEESNPNCSQDMPSYKAGGTNETCLSLEAFQCCELTWTYVIATCSSHSLK